MRRWPGRPQWSGRPPTPVDLTPHLRSSPGNSHRSRSRSRSCPGHRSPLLREVLAVGHRRDVLEESSLVGSRGREVDRKAGLGVGEAAMRVPMADRDVPPLVEVDVALHEQRVDAVGSDRVGHVGTVPAAFSALRRRPHALPAEGPAPTRSSRRRGRPVPLGPRPSGLSSRLARSRSRRRTTRQPPRSPLA